MTHHILDPIPGRAGTICGETGRFSAVSWGMRLHPSAKVNCAACLVLADLATAVDVELRGR